MTRLSAPERVRRLLAVIPWVAARGEVTLDEVAARFGYERKRLAQDLREIVPMVGVYPFTPDTLIEVDLDDDLVRIRYADWFTRPLRLDGAQTMLLTAAAESMLAFDPAAGDEDDPGPLLRGLTKLRTAMDAADDGVPMVVRLGDASGEVLATLRRATDDHRVVTIDHYVYSRDEWIERAVEPWRFYADEGHWYLAGHCRRAGEARVFRVDRIRSAELSDETFAAPPLDDGGTGPGFDAEAAPRVTLRLAPEAAWVAEQYPHDALERTDDGALDVTLAVTGEAWLERLLLRLGPLVEVVDSGPFPDDLVARAARRILARYR